MLVRQCIYTNNKSGETIILISFDENNVTLADDSVISIEEFNSEYTIGIR